MIHDFLESTLIKVALTTFVVGCGLHGVPYEREGSRWYSQKAGSRSKFVFPSNNNSDQFQGQLYRDWLYTMPVPSCQNTTFCEKPSYYPDDLVNFAVEMDDTFKYFAMVDKLVQPDTENEADLSNIILFCPSIAQIVYPKTAENQYNQWSFVINHDKFRQGVGIEVCRNETNHELKKLPVDFGVRCRQLYTYRQLATLLPDGTIKLEALRFPSECRGYVSLSEHRKRIDQSYRRAVKI